MASELQCYRKGCGKTYVSAENCADSCQHHTGVPVFHDALKGWSCCNKKSTDFSVFLDMPGCTFGFHSNEKPPPTPKIESKPLADELVIRGPPPPSQRSERPDVGEPMVPLRCTVGATLKQALEKRLANLNIDTEQTESQGSDGVVQIGTACKNNSCRSHYEGPESNEQECQYHPGVPIFHEGMKYWSCCQKKTSEFDKFLEQLGCESGRHNWVATAKDEAKEARCRMDWHQTSGSVIISVFSKCADPTKTIIKANSVCVSIFIVYEGDKIYSETIELNGVINLAKSSVKLLGAKVEISLKKADAESWAQLVHKPVPKDCGEAK